MVNKKRIPWNIGLTKDTDERVKQYSEKNSKIKKGRIGKNRKYSFDPNDWFNICVVCQEIKYYTNRDSYVNAVRKIKKDNTEYKCCTCSAGWSKKDIELRIKDRERRKLLQSLPDDVRKEETYKIRSEKRKEYWANLTDVERNLRNEKISKTKLEMEPERKLHIYKIVSDKNKERMLDDLGNPIFRPGYNKHTIPYINVILNRQYDTIFRHAESPDGEFKIYDSEFKKFYYADAYCSKLNMWIEFDEPIKFKNGKLLESHINREERIKFLLPNIQLIRIYFDKNMCKNIMEN